MKAQFELFTADIVSFPLWRRADLVRHTADTLTTLPFDRRQDWWTRHCLDLAAEIQATGKDEGDTTGILQRYANAVANEIDWRQGQRVGPGAA